MNPFLEIARQNCPQPVAELVCVGFDPPTGKTEEFACINVGEEQGYRPTEGVHVNSRESLITLAEAVEHSARLAQAASEATREHEIDCEFCIQQILLTVPHKFLPDCQSDIQRRIPPILKRLALKP